MTSGEMDLFNDRMKELGERIENIVEIVIRYAELREVLGEVWSKGLMRDLESKIQDNPNSMIEQSDFMNQYIPRLEELVVAYSKIKKRARLSKEEELFLEEALGSLGYLANKIKESYIEYNKPEVKDLDEFNEYVKAYLVEGGK